MAKQQGIEGSNRGLILSLLCDHMLYFHNGQLTQFKNKEQAVTVGSLREKIIMESLIVFIEQIVKSDNPKELLEIMADQISSLFQLRLSIKHLRKFDTPHDNQQETCML